MFSCLLEIDHLFANEVGKACMHNQAALWRFERCCHAWNLQTLESPFKVGNWGTCVAMSLAQAQEDAEGANSRGDSGLIRARIRGSVSSKVLLEQGNSCRHLVSSGVRGLCYIIYIGASTPVKMLVFVAAANRSSCFCKLPRFCVTYIGPYAQTC